MDIPSRNQEEKNEHLTEDIFLANKYMKICLTWLINKCRLK